MDCQPCKVYNHHWLLYMLLSSIHHETIQKHTHILLWNQWRVFTCKKKHKIQTFVYFQLPFTCKKRCATHLNIAYTAWKQTIGYIYSLCSKRFIWWCYIYMCVYVCVGRMMECNTSSWLWQIIRNIQWIPVDWLIKDCVWSLLYISTTDTCYLIFHCSIQQ